MPYPPVPYPYIPVYNYPISTRANRFQQVVEHHRIPSAQGQQQRSANRSGQAQQDNRFTPRERCYRCGSNHDCTTCPAKTKTCTFYHKVGHKRQQIHQGQEDVATDQLQARENLPSGDPAQVADDNITTANQEDQQDPFISALLEQVRGITFIPHIEELPRSMAEANIPSPTPTEGDEIDNLLEDPETEISWSEISNHTFSLEVGEALQHLDEILGDEDTISQPVEIHQNRTTGVSLESRPETMPLSANNKFLTMEVGCGASVALIPQSVYTAQYSEFPVKLVSEVSAVSGSVIVVSDCFAVTVQRPPSGNTYHLPLVAVESTRLTHSLLWRNWLDVRVPSWRNAFRIQLRTFAVMTSVVKDLKKLYAKFFDPDNQDPIKGYEATIHVKEGCAPLFHKPYTVPFAMIPIMDEKLDALQASDRIYPVRNSRWAPPILFTNKKEHSSSHSCRYQTYVRGLQENC